MKWKDLGGEERYRVLELARKGEMSLKQICETFGVSHDDDLELRVGLLRQPGQAIHQGAGPAMRQPGPSHLSAR